MDLAAARAVSVPVTSLDAFFESYYRLRPVNATFTGVHEYDDRLPDWSPDGCAAALDEMRALHASVSRAAANDEPRLTDVDARDRALAIAFLEIQIAELEGVHFQRGNPSLAIGEAIFAAIALMTRPFAPVAVRADAAIARLEATRAFLAGARASIAQGVPDLWRARCLRECEGADRLLDGGISAWPSVEPFDAARAGRLRHAAENARGAFDEFRRWLTRDVPASPADGCACGPDFLDLLLTRGHWCTRSRAELAADADTALNDALACLDDRTRRAGDRWPDVQERLADRHPSIDDYLPTYDRIWTACRERARALDLLTWPEYPIRYVPIPPHTRDAAPYLYYLFYRSPAPFDTVTPHDYVVTPIEPDMPPDEQTRRLRATNTSVMTLNHVVHHGSIGHHVQNYYAYRGESSIGRIAAVDCATRIGMFSGGTMAEGWACYATDLMDRAGFLTPDESLAQQHARARLAARAVVDIGLHEGSLTVDRAIAIYRDRIGMSADAARAEVCKNSMFPGTAVMYRLGTEALHDLRRTRERLEGDRFSPRAFHDRLLSYGSIPVPLVARLMS